MLNGTFGVSFGTYSFVLGIAQRFEPIYFHCRRVNALDEDTRKQKAKDAKTFKTPTCTTCTSGDKKHTLIMTKGKNLSRLY